MNAIGFEARGLRRHGDAYGSFYLLVDAAGCYARQTLVEVQGVAGERVFHGNELPVYQLEKPDVKIEEKRVAELEWTRTVAVVQAEVAITVGVVEGQEQQGIAAIRREQAAVVAETQPRHPGITRLFRLAGKQERQQP